MLGYQLFTDDELVLYLKQGDHAAFTEIYVRYAGALYNHAYHLLQNRNEVKDIVQEIFTALWNRRANLEIKTNLAGYLYVAARNRVIKIISHQKIKTKYLDQLPISIHDATLSTDYLVRERQLVTIIEDEIKKLPLRMREILILSRQSYLSHREIAEKLNLSESTVKKQVNNSLKVLRIKLQSFMILAFLLVSSFLWYMYD